MSGWVFLFAYLGAIVACGLLMFWLMSFESFETYYTLAVLVGGGIAMYDRWKRRGYGGTATPTEQARPKDLLHTAAKAPSTASAIPTEVRDEWNDPLPVERLRIREAQPGAGPPPEGDLFTEGFVPDKPFSPPIGGRSVRRP